MRNLADGALAAVVVVLVLMFSTRAESRRVRVVSGAGLGLGVFAFVGLIALRTLAVISNPPAWDFPVFYTVGRAARLGLDYYDPAVLASVFADISQRVSVPGAWLRESPGWWYAPPTALYLLPFGLLSYKVALAAHTAVQIAALTGSVVLMAKQSETRPGLNRFAVLLLLTLAFPPTRDSLVLGQITFGALIMVVLSLRYIDTRPGMAGALSGLGAVFKHLVLIPAVFMAGRRVRLAVASLLSFTGATVVAVLVFGADSVSGFLSGGPADRPALISMDPVIQSLLGVLRRAFGDVPGRDGALAAILYWPYIIAALLIIGLTVVVIHANRKGARPDSRLDYSLALVAALLVYPNTLGNTLVLLLPAIAVLWDRCRSVFSEGALVGGIALVFFLSAQTAVPGGFFAMVVLYVLLSVGALRLVRWTDEAT